MTGNKIPLSVIPGFYVDGSPVAPTQPPDKCPACGAKVTSMSTDGFREFACGKMQRISDGVYGSVCHNAEAAAVSLRAERDAALAQLANRSNELPCTDCIGDGCDACGKTGLYKSQKAIETLLARSNHATEEVERLTLMLEQEQRNYKNCRSVLDDTEADRDALTARLAELQAVCDELSKYKANMKYYKSGYCGGCETCGSPPYPEADEPEYLMSALTKIEQAIAALASGAVVEGETK